MKTYGATHAPTQVPLPLLRAACSHNTCDPKNGIYPAPLDQHWLFVLGTVHLTQFLVLDHVGENKLKSLISNQHGKHKLSSRLTHLCLRTELPPCLSQPDAPLAPPTGALNPSLGIQRHRTTRRSR